MYISTRCQQLIIRNLRKHVEQCGEEFKDDGTADFLTGLMEQHEQMAWMLRSFIEGESISPDGKQPKAKTPTASHA